MNNAYGIIDLARVADFSLATLSVRPSLRQVESGGVIETVEPRVLQVLVALAQRRGDVVSRDEMTARCWQGRIVGNDAIEKLYGPITGYPTTFIIDRGGTIREHFVGGQSPSVIENAVKQLL